jgi:hypothetical protein
MPVEVSLSEIHESGSAGKTIARYIEPREALSYGWVCVSSQRRFPFLGKQHGPEDIINSIDPLDCAIALGWDEGVEIKKIPLNLEIKDGWLYLTVDESGKPTRAVTRVNGDKSNEFWLDMMVGKNDE